MYLGDFQICLRDHEPRQYLKLRRIWDPLELQIRKDIPRKLTFGGVRKIVLELGPEKTARPKYRVLLDVGLYHVADFDSEQFLVLPSRQQRAQIAHTVHAAMVELAAHLQAPVEWLTDSIARTAFGA
jgi:hypothetical protein